MDLLTKEESYAERRQLFKNIWDTAMHIDEKDAEILNKPKVIKTLRLDEVDRCALGRKKKQRIKNLRTVCNRILDFCDRQDADDIFYQQVIADGQESPQPEIELLTKNTKNYKIKKKQMKKVKSLFSPHNELAQAKATTSERKDITRNAIAKISRNTSPIKYKRTTILKNSQITNQSIKSKTRPRAIIGTNIMLGDTSSMKGHKKKRTKKKKTIVPPNILECPEP